MEHDDLKSYLAEAAAQCTTGYLPIGVYSKWGAFSNHEVAHKAFEELREATEGLSGKVHTVSTQYVATWAGCPESINRRVSMWYDMREQELVITIDYMSGVASNERYIVKEDSIRIIATGGNGTHERRWARYVSNGRRPIWVVVWSTFPRAPTYHHRDYIPMAGVDLKHEIYAMVSSAPLNERRQYTQAIFIKCLEDWQIVPKLSSDYISYLYSNLARLYGELRKITTDVVTRSDVMWVMSILDQLTLPGYKTLTQSFLDTLSDDRAASIEWMAIPLDPPTTIKE